MREKGGIEYQENKGRGERITSLEERRKVRV